MLGNPLEPIDEPATLVGGFVRVPAGQFEMGGLETDKYVSAVELPRRMLSFAEGFSISSVPVTERDWACFDPDRFRSGTASMKPMVRVSSAEIADYTRWLSERNPGKRFRLPNESEWEYACRGGERAIFPRGNQISTEDANYLYDEQRNPVGPAERTAVKSYPANSFGLFDMVGNVCEWTSSPWRSRLDSGEVDHDRRVIRGGAWDHMPRLLRCSWRDWAPVEARYDNLGFRLIEETIPQ
jgi:formylglycine-generating enzyme required for sulfatase activity